MNDREVGKIVEYKTFKDEIARMWGMKKVTVIPVFADLLGAIQTGFVKYTAAIGIEVKVEYPQKIALVRTAKF